MIKKVQIKNFKSVVDLSLELGNFNVLIGENGCGKSNILEALAFGAAANADKLDFEFLGSRGIRVTNPEFMYSAFSSSNKKRKIRIKFYTDDDLFKDILFQLTHDPKNSKKWINESKDITDKEVGDRLAESLFQKNQDSIVEKLHELLELKDERIIASLLDIADNIKTVVLKNNGSEEEGKEFFKFIFNNQYLHDKYSNESISNFIIYSPEESSLRKFEETTQIYPLGIKGEGLFQYLKELTLNKNSKRKIKEIKESLMFLDWYESFELPENLLQNEFSISIKDKYINESLKYFDQRSTNEGFLFLLFFATLFSSNETPNFFAIDNIDNSFNPKLCMQITRTLSALAKKHNKQVIVTTQNPAILDGLNLSDDSQRLFVVSRNSKGHTRTERINHEKDRTMKLSEIWTKGFIGGLPSNF